MGLTHLKIEVANPANLEIWETVDCLVDSGAVYSVVPSGALAALGIRPIGEQAFRLANGELLTRRKGIAAFRYGDKIGGADVVFGEDGDMNLLGALTLEALGLSLDPLKRELKELPMMLA